MADDVRDLAEEVAELERQDLEFRLALRAIRMAVRKARNRLAYALDCAREERQFRLARALAAMAKEPSDE